MGYYTHVTGRITIEPPLPWGQITGSRYLPEKLGGEFSGGINLAVIETTHETDEGTLTKRSAVAIEPYEDSFKAYTTEEELQALVKEFGEGRRFSGHLYGEGEEQGDMWKLEVVDGEVVKVTPTVTWP